MNAKLTQDQVDLLNKPVLAHIATVNLDGSPQVTPVWVDTDGEAVIFNTAKGRVKHQNIERTHQVAVSVSDPENDYSTVVLKGTATLIDEGADAHIDKMAKKYLGKDSYPFRKSTEQRVIVRVVPDSIVRMG